MLWLATGVPLGLSFLEIAAAHVRVMGRGQVLHLHAIVSAGLVTVMSY